LGAVVVEDREDGVFVDAAEGLGPDDGGSEWCYGWVGAGDTYQLVPKLIYRLELEGRLFIEADRGEQPAAAEEALRNTGVRCSHFCKQVGIATL
jgi:hypothetical protein